MIRIIVLTQFGRGVSKEGINMIFKHYFGDKAPESVETVGGARYLDAEYCYRALKHPEKDRVVISIPATNGFDVCYMDTETIKIFKQALAMSNGRTSWEIAKEIWDKSPKEPQ